jgi:hypothetical protein
VAIGGKILLMVINSYSIGGKKNLMVINSYFIGGHFWQNFVNGY